MVLILNVLTNTLWPVGTAFKLRKLAPRTSPDNPTHAAIVAGRLISLTDFDGFVLVFFRRGSG
jgi:hypothetical protein